MNILHITPHLGGGVGTVVLNWLSEDHSNTHTIITLDTANELASNICAKYSIALFEKSDRSFIFENIKQTDIVVVHFWNHPLLYDLIIRSEFPPCRMVFWSHISGLQPPNVITDKILRYPDKFIYTSPVSSEIIENPVILSTGDISSFFEVELKPHAGFTVGYVGTVDYVKMHPQYIEVLSKTSSDKFIIVGGGNYERICKSCSDNRFQFVGKVSDVKKYLSQMDVFGYLLNPAHFGTAEQVLQEALACGVVPVVLNNKCEANLIKHMRTGLVANNLSEYIAYIDLLKTDIDLRKKLSKNGIEYAKKTFSTNSLIYEWNTVFNDMIVLPKTRKKWEYVSSTEISSYDIFLESLGQFSTLFKDKNISEIKKLISQPHWQSNSKGTPRQYYNFLKGEELRQICYNTEL